MAPLNTHCCDACIAAPAQCAELH